MIVATAWSLGSYEPRISDVRGLLNRGYALLSVWEECHDDRPTAFQTADEARDILWLDAPQYPFDADRIKAGSWVTASVAGPSRNSPPASATASRNMSSRASVSAG